MKVIFTCGGTAGHVNPALALAGYMQKQDPQVQVLFVGTPDGMERGPGGKGRLRLPGHPHGGFQRSLGPAACTTCTVPVHADQIPQPGPGHPPGFPPRSGGGYRRLRQLSHGQVRRQGWASPRRSTSPTWSPVSPPKCWRAAPGASWWASRSAASTISTRTRSSSPAPRCGATSSARPGSRPAEAGTHRRPAAGRLLLGQSRRTIHERAYAGLLPLGGEDGMPFTTSTPPARKQLGYHAPAGGRAATLTKTRDWTSGSTSTTWPRSCGRRIW